MTVSSTSPELAELVYRLVASTHASSLERLRVELDLRDQRKVIPYYCAEGQPAVRLFESLPSAQTTFSILPKLA
jgi:hypothetical protein